ncbi:MAG: exodeoxyribonuclease VII small subunit [Clostridiales bacterium]|nr:exodeoxyribonuclease VII small subunit [Clostridiales bacterium]
MAAKSSKKALSFEEGLNQLEAMAQEMENSGLPLEEMLKLYEEGVKLAGELSGKLETMKAALETVRPATETEPTAIGDGGQLTLDDWMGEEQQ